MGSRVRGVTVVVVVLTVGAFLGSAVEQWWEEPASAAGGLEPTPLVDERVRVEVLNGAGEVGWAREATGWLRDHGFDVVDYGNADTFEHDTSVVLDRIGRPELARAVADALEIEVVRSEPDSNLYLDVSVVLGEDWEPPSSEPAPREEPSWWDVRRFFRGGEEAGGEASPGRIADPGERGEGGS